MEKDKFTTTPNNGKIQANKWMEREIRNLIELFDTTIGKYYETLKQNHSVISNGVTVFLGNILAMYC